MLPIARATGRFLPRRRKEFGLTEEKLALRKQELLMLHEKMVAQINVLRGSISECDYWIGELEHLEPEEASDSDE